MAKFFRWVPKVHAANAIQRGLLSHNGSAMWLFDLTQAYRPGNAISNNAILIAYELDVLATANLTTRQHIDFESDEFLGENQHPNHIIVKNNEIGAYGVGRMRQAVTNLHTRTRYATKPEVAKALGINQMEVDPKYKPATGWPV